MTNKEIIANAAVQLGIYTEEEVRIILEQGEEIPLHTISGWKKEGNYIVKDGEEGVEVHLWRAKEDGKGFYKAKAYLYKKEQLQEE